MTDMYEEILAHIEGVVRDESLPATRREIVEAAHRVNDLLGDILEEWDARKGDEDDD